MAAAKQTRARSATGGSLTPAVLFAMMLPVTLIFDWSWRWMLSGAPALTFCILLGDASRRRVLSFVNGWTMFATINLLYSIVSTSWLLYWVFTAFCYPAILLTCMMQFKIAAHLTRRAMRGLIKQVHFIDDKIALFDIPALEIDTEVAGLFVIRGITFSLSTLSFIVHGVEVGIKLADDLELAIQTEKVVVALFRRIDVGDCFANIKGGNNEMTFGDSDTFSLNRQDSGSIFETDSPLLKAISSRNNSMASQIGSEQMKEDFTNGNAPKDSSAHAAMKGIQTVSSQNDPAGLDYHATLKGIDDTSAVRQSREHVQRVIKRRDQEKESKKEEGVAITRDDLRAAICSHLHSKPSVSNPPERSIKVTTLQNLPPPMVKAFMHRLPFLLRLLLNILAYFHAVKIQSVTATASGRWIESMLVSGIFKGYGNTDSQLRNFKQRISAWVSGANFAVQLGKIQGYSQVPVDFSYDIKCQLSIKTISVYRTLPKEVDQTQVAQISGADASFSIPTFLLPHHEHIIPEQGQIIEDEVDTDGSETDDSYSNQSSKQNARKDEIASQTDEANVKISAHASLPAVVNQELLDFIAILVKASKLVELEQQSPTSNSEKDDDEEDEKHRLSALKQKLKLGMTKAVVANDQWLARQVGKVMKKLEQVSGDVGYSGDIPVQLAPYRQTGWEKEGDKLLP